MNLDAITVAQRLASDKTMRQAFVAQAEKAQPTNGTPSVEDLDAQLAKLRELGAPIGWAQGFPGPQNSTGALANGWSSIGPWLMVIFGWLVTAGAISFGAPFWFDVLNKFMVIRSTVKPREKSQEEGSEDRQPAVGANRAAQAPAAAPAARAAGPAPAAGVAPAPPPAPTKDDMEFEPDSWAAGFRNVNEVVV
ncbi:hypothetical protein IHQ68_19215 [Chelatococcus sambhunathii]|uniref:Uncharacterized protein n=1 Tax=Chelatococcus sambhunathii TaxID=363953 RepID=A0ABU1DKT4_9HYPH|nr:hypothetical protein [Chelatococcus sambhunathii]MDR4308756.1 hypothetical protein [Chelatococcus sambhunathii]